MTHERDIDRLLDLWLIDGPTEVSDRVVLDVADRIERQPQRPAWRFPRRPTIMSNSVRWAAVIVALALMAVVGFAVLGRPSDSGIIGVSPSDSSAPTDSPRTSRQLRRLRLTRTFRPARGRPDPYLRTRDGGRARCLYGRRRHRRANPARDPARETWHPSVEPPMDGRPQACADRRGAHREPREDP